LGSAMASGNMPEAYVSILIFAAHTSIMEVVRLKRGLLFIWAGGDAMTLKVVKLDGDLDFSRKAHVAALLSEADNADIVLVDLSGVSYIDSSCLSCLAVQKKRMHENGTAAIVRIAGASESLRRIFKICGLDTTFELYRSLEDAQSAGALSSH